MPYRDHTPDAIKALVALVQAAVTTQKVDCLVKDGTWLSEESKKHAICIGWSGFPPGFERPSLALSEAEGQAASTTQTVQEGLMPVLHQQIEINCIAMFRGGETKDNAPIVRDGAYALVNLVGAVVMTTPNWLNGTVKNATMGAATALHYSPNRRGYDALVTFSVSCQAFSQ